MLVPIASQRALLSYLILTFLFLFAFFTSQTPYHLFDRAASHRWMNSADSGSASDVIAIDIALLPPPQHPLTQAIHQYNALLNSSFHFDTTHYAHMTLIQMYMKRERLSELIEHIQTLLLHHNTQNTLVLTATTIQTDTTPSDTTTSSSTTTTTTGTYGTMMVISKTEALLNLQSLLHTLVLSFYVKTDGDNNHFYIETNDNNNNNNINLSTKQYVSNFFTSSSLNNYYPHITIGFATNQNEINILHQKEQEMIQTKSYGEWKPDRLYIFQLGNHGTCRKQLAEIKLT